MNALRWDLSPSEAIALQRELAARVRCEDDFAPPRWIAGVDVSTSRGSEEGYAAIVVLRLPELEIVEVAEARMPMPMPYIPGLLSFREVPVALAAYARLTVEPDLILVDGQGRAHPRRFGIACHLGVLLDKPTIGCAKSILVGTHDALPPERGSTAPLVHRQEVVGVAVRTKTKVNPVFVSCGHRISLETAVRWVLDCARGYRLPEPTRQAHLASNAFRIRTSAANPPSDDAPPAG
ncbi:Endonuclease V [compost metagenome]